MLHNNQTKVTAREMAVVEVAVAVAAAAVAATRKVLSMSGRAMPTVLRRGNFAQRVLQQRTSTNASSSLR